MGFTEIEAKGKKALEQFPALKRSAKRVYQVASVITNKDRVKAEGNIVRVSPIDDYEYYYGYYDKSPWDASGRYMICLRASHTNKSVAPHRAASVCLIDTEDNNRLIIVGVSYAWNVQQGCMAQWLGPDFESRIIYNGFINGAYCSTIYNVKEMRVERVLPMPVYDVSRDGKTALSLDFNRLHRMRPGYGYSNMPDMTNGILCPDRPCIWKIDLETGETEPLLKYTDFASFEHDPSMEGAEHKVNHLMISPNGKRFMVLHRWFQKGRKHTRLVTVNMDGTDMYNLSDDVFVSHCYWKNDEEILSFLRKKETGDHYYLMKDKTQKYRMFWPELKTDGHCSYSPDGRLIVTDTYPNRKRIASVYICTEEDDRARRIARVFSPFKYDNDCRCDLHPRWSRDGKKICIDSVHEGKRGLYVIDVPEIDTERYEKEEEKQHAVTVMMASYNGEKYIREQIESILAQKGVKVTLLVRDDGSSDRTQEILEEYQQKGLLSWYTGEHLNVAKGFLDLMKHAPKADYYAFSDQDDVWDDNKLLIAVTELDAMDQDKPAMYFSGQRLVDADLNLLSVHSISNERSPHTMFLISNAAGCTTVFNSKLLEAVNEAEPDYVFMHDSWLVKVCLALGGSYFADPSAHISYRQHDSNVAGIKGGLKGKLRQAKRYIEVFEVQRQCKELMRCYGDRMIPEYWMLTNDIISYDEKKASKKRIMKDFDFKSGSLNAVVKLKILLKKL